MKVLAFVDIVGEYDTAYHDLSKGGVLVPNDFDEKQEFIEWKENFWENNKPKTSWIEYLSQKYESVEIDESEFWEDYLNKYII